MKISKLDKQQKLFDLYKQLGSMSMVVTVNGDIVLDDELKATIFAAIEPVLKRRISKGEVLPVFEGSEAMQIDAFAGEDAAMGKESASVDADTIPFQEAESSGLSSNRRKRISYVDGFEKP